jgi:four helix bundle protein
VKIENYKDKLKKIMDEYVHFVYRVTKNFPKDELYGVTSQIRRATLSVILNYIEGYARRKPAVQLNFLETSYGSFKESKYLLYFSFIEKYLNKDDYETGLGIAERIGAMLWTEILNLERSIKNP